MRILILSMLLALVACAATGYGGGSVTIETTSKGQVVTGANCSVRTNGGSWNLITPGTVMVGGANGDLHVVCDKAGYRTSELVFTPSGRSASNIGVGLGGGSGHVGLGVGMNFPVMSSGDGYPPRITIDMSPQQ
ncbi:MAG TPA: hypothetical protein VJ577_16545 [Burkholderiaceae bacterium]|nr:hypothetical protein [Burkholderiaceae bacterium]